MIVCCCNRISDDRAREACRDGACRSAGDVYRAFGCRVQCGKCLPEMRRLFDEAAAERARPREAPSPAVRAA